MALSTIGPLRSTNQTAPKPLSASCPPLKLENSPPRMAPPLAAILRRHLPLLPRLHLLLSSHHLRLSTSHYPSDQSDFEPDPDNSFPPPDDDGELASFLHRISSAASAASSLKHAISLLLSSSSSSGQSPASPALLVRALWELRRDPDAAALAIRYGDACSAVSGDEGLGEGPPPPAEAWHLAVWATGKARRFDLAWAVVRRMRRRGVLTPRAMVILMERYAAANEVNKAIKTFDVMEKFKVEADQTVFYSLLRALCKSKNIEDAEELLLLRKKFFPLTAEGFNIILDGWCNVITDVAEAKRVWREMSNYCITPDGMSYTLMVSCFSKAGNLFDTLRVYDEMKRRGWTPGIGVYNSLIYVLTRENCMKDAHNIFSKLTDEGLQPDVETYNSMIIPLCESCKLDEARMVMEGMILKGIVPTILMYHAFLKQEGIDESLKLLQKMKEDGNGPNSDTFLMLLDKFFQVNESGNALRVWNEMRRYDISPARSHYMTVVQGLVKHGCIPRALEYYDEMKEKGFASDTQLDKEFKTFLLANRDHWRGAGKYNIIPQRGKHFTRRSRMQ
ncbi:pentatricopeptide repeat-containing protein At1g80880, mitochondrial [Phragmites australis]|uniref:pentatricopeptide repeat-containing protein At1g80880, mitochondrial n=1 Tax=Phragmites australis TaxID=29695 RepID=UPI002D7A2C5F|nr:pentatricopeptide repeat-containing protein At1g80880, mitochondrial [Phragmites australis]XP_062194856.1 pentatricopeptide repeat-containing protein At1g80880, mitochondrial [Phragmites australis]